MTFIRGTKFFWRDIQNSFFQKVPLGPIRWVPKRFFKIWIFYSRNLHFNLGFLSAYAETILSHTELTKKQFHRTLSSGKTSTVFTCTALLSIRGNDFIAPSIRGNDLNAGWAYEEMISSLTEHTRKCLKVEYLGRIEYDFQKSRVTGFGTVRIWFLQKST